MTQQLTAYSLLTEDLSLVFSTHVRQLTPSVNCHGSLFVCIPMPHIDVYIVDCIIIDFFVGVLNSSSIRFFFFFYVLQLVILGRPAGNPLVTDRLLPGPFSPLRLLTLGSCCLGTVDLPQAIFLGQVVLLLQFSMRLGPKDRQNDAQDGWMDPAVTLRAVGLRFVSWSRW